MSSSANRLIEFLDEKVSIEDLNAQTPLFSSGDLDSVAQMDLIVFIESEFRIEIKQYDITLENFDTVDNIVNFIDRQLSA